MKIFIPILTFILLLNFQGDAHCGGCASDAKSDKDHSRDHSSGESHSHETSATTETSTVEATSSTVNEAKTYQTLNLTEKQEAKYGKLITDYEEKFQKLEKDFVKKVKKILTDEQYKSFVENNKELKSNTGS